MEKFNQGFKEFAAKAQQLVRDQQQKLALQRELPATQIQRSSEFSDDIENALRLLQIQNRSLKDRLRSVAEENERLNDQVRQLTVPSISNHTIDAPKQTAPLGMQATGPAAVDSNGTTRDASSTRVENDALKRQISELKRDIRSMEERYRTANSHAESLKAELFRAQQMAAEAAELRTTLEAEARDAKAEVQNLTQIVASLRAEQGELPVQSEAGADLVEQLQQENAALQAAAPASSSQRTQEIGMPNRESSSNATMNDLQDSAVREVGVGQPEQDLSFDQEEIQALRAQVWASEAARAAAAEQVLSLREMIADLEDRLTRTEMAAVAAAENAREEVVWLQKGAEELQRQLQAAKSSSSSNQMPMTKTEAPPEVELTIHVVDPECETAASITRTELERKEALMAELQQALDDAREEASKAAERAVIADAVRRSLEEKFADAMSAQENEIRRLRDEVTSLNRSQVAPEPEHSVEVPPQAEQEEVMSSEVLMSRRGASPTVIFPPHHQRDASYSSEIEPVLALGPSTTVDGPKDAAQGLASTTNYANSTRDGDDVALRVADLERALRDSEHTHELRDTATYVLKEEIAELQRQQKRADVDLDYLKAVLVEGFASGELKDERHHMVPVLGRLLQFSPSEMERAAHKRKEESMQVFGVTMPMYGTAATASAILGLGGRA